VPWKIAHSSRAIIGLVSSVIRRLIVQKKCQKGINMRQNASKGRAVYVYREARAHLHSSVLSRSFRCCSFSQSRVSQTCSQLIHTRFEALLASGLETRNQLRKRQEKNEFNFNYSKKIFLTGKIKRASRRQNGNMCRNDFAEQTPRRFSSPGRTDFAADYLRVPS
jgi:hypothetical protein